VGAAYGKTMVALAAWNFEILFHEKTLRFYSMEESAMAVCDAANWPDGAGALGHVFTSRLECPPS
jgi:hypothetical protein